MNLIVCLKQTFDTEAKIQLNSSGGIDSNGVNLVINPYDEFAVEEALKLKETFGGEVTLVCVGKEKAQEALRTALAMGCDQAVLICDPALENADEWAVAEVLAKVVGQLPFDLILAGRIAVDDGSGQVAVRLAEALHIPSVSSIVKLEAEVGNATVAREIDGGTELIEVSLPAVFTAQKGLNIPRYPTMLGIMKAKKKELKVLTLSDLGMAADTAVPKMKCLSYSLPKPRTGGKKIDCEPCEAAKELSRLLREEAKVI
jgi:electron transfer flavoprotein beta subunit